MVVGVTVTVCLRAAPLLAQQRPERRYAAGGIRLEFPPNAVWRAKARQVARTRALLRSQGRLSVLNAPALLGGAAPQLAATAVTGTLRYPTILIGFRDTDTSNLPAAVYYDSIIYTAQPLTGGPSDTTAGGVPFDKAGARPYTVRTFYQEMSHGLFSVGGAVYGWILAPDSASYYLDACGTSSNILDCSTGLSRMRQLFAYALHYLDSLGVNFAQYDGNGDGQVDLVQFIDPTVGGECNGQGIWAHHFTLAGLPGGAYTMTDSSSNGVTVGAYQVMGGVGGLTCKDTTQIMGIGTSAHETGHGLNLPDLYDVSGATEGVGEWSLMGSGNYTSLFSPAHMDAWSKEQLGWVVVRQLDTAGTYQLGPVVTGDTVMLIRPRGANPRGEYFLLENKQPLGADTSNLNTGSTCTSGCTGPKRGGLLVWHVDSTKLAIDGFNTTNSVNAGYPHGLELVQADNLSQLDASRSGGGNRGDAGDPYPGTSGNTLYSLHSHPVALKNSDGSFTGIGLSAIHQDVTSGPMSFTLAFGSIVRPSDTLAVITVSGVPYHRFFDVLSPDSAVTVSVPSPQTSADGRARFAFSAWSDGQAQTHQVAAAGVGDSLVATLQAQYQLLVTRKGSALGTVAATPAADVATGAFFPAGTSVTLVAQGGPDSVFSGWSGDTTSARDTLVLTMRRPYTLAARFIGLEAAVDELLGVDSLLTRDERDYFDTAGNANGKFDLGDFLAWVKRTGAKPAAALMARLMARAEGRP